MKKCCGALFLAFLMVVSLAGCGVAVNEKNNAVRSFRDSCGREVLVPEKIERIAVTGPMAQIIVFALAPDLLAGVSSRWDEAALPYIPQQYADLPVLGQLYGGKGELNPESLLASGAQVVIDIGDDKDGVGGDMDQLQQQTGLPFVHINSSLDSLDKTYEMLGALLQREDEAQVLSQYCRRTYDRAAKLAADMKPVTCLYLLGDKGCNVIGKGTYHSGVIDLMADNIAVLESPSSKGTGNEVDMEQIMLWDPEFIVFAPGSVYESVGSDPIWQKLSAVREGRYAEAPLGPYNWMAMPPSAQQLLGLIWMGSVLYPNVCGYDLYTETAEYFQLFYHTELTQAQLDKLVK